MKAKKRSRKWTGEQRQAARDRWTPEMREEARLRSLMYHHKPLFEKIFDNPKARQKLKELARG